MDFSKYDHGDFFRLWLARMRLPITQPNLRACAAISIFESSEGNEKWNNPFACEQSWPGDRFYNEAGVRIYASVEDGVNATATMYSNSTWAPVRHALGVAAPSRQRALEAWSRIYTWADHPDFVGLYNVGQLETRLAHPLAPVS